MLKTLIPILLPTFPPALISVANDIMLTPGVITPDGIDFNKIGEVLPKAVMQNEDAAKTAINVVLKGVGVQPQAAQYAAEFVFSKAEHDEEAVKAFGRNFASLNKPPALVNLKPTLPYGCKECQRIHYHEHEVRTDSRGRPICIRCNRTIHLNQ